MPPSPQEAGRFEEALGHYRRAEEAKKRRTHAVLRGLHARIATCLGYLGREARAVLAGLLEAEPRPDADTYWAIIHTFSVLGDAPSVREWARRARRLYPDDPRFRTSPEVKPDRG